MNRHAIWARLRAYFVAGAAGWGAAMTVTLPMQFFEVLTINWAGGLRVVLLGLAQGTMIWAGWLLAITGFAWLCVGLPVIAIIREAWLLRHRGRAIAIAGASSWVVVLCEFKMWRFLLPNYYDISVWLFVLYSLLVVTFATVTAWVYLRLVASAIAGEQRSSLPASVNLN